MAAGARGARPTDRQRTGRCARDQLDAAGSGRESTLGLHATRARSIIAPAAFQAEGSGENAALKLIKAMDETLDRDALLAKVAELKLDRLNEFMAPPADDKEEGEGDD